MYDLTLADFAAELRRCCADMRWSQATLVERTRKDKGVISRVWRGLVAPDRETLDAILKALRALSPEADLSDLRRYGEKAQLGRVRGQATGEAKQRLFDELNETIGLAEAERREFAQALDDAVVIATHLRNLTREAAIPIPGPLDEALDRLLTGHQKRGRRKR